MTIEEQERAAYASGDTKLADALAIIIGLENEAADLRAIIRDALDDTDSEVLGEDWAARAQAAPGRCLCFTTCSTSFLARRRGSFATSCKARPA